MGIRTRLAVVALVLLCFVARQPAAAPDQNAPKSPDLRWADWVEPQFPFFSSVIDARAAGSDFPTDNLTPRALVLNLGEGHWAAFDVDLLRVSAIWNGAGVTAKALAPGSYRHPDRKTPGGQFPAPEPDGRVALANGIYPGWQRGAEPSFSDPRAAAPSPEEVGRGPLPEQMGKFNAVRLVGAGVVLEYSAAGTSVREWMKADRANAVTRHFEVGPSREPLWLVLGFTREDVAVSIGTNGSVTPEVQRIPVTMSTSARKTASARIASASTTKSPNARVGEAHAQGNTVNIVRLPAHDTPVQFSVALGETATGPAASAERIPTDAPARRWPAQITTKVTLSTAKDAYVVDDIALPLANPWRRNVRLSDIQFLKDGTGVGVTIDGDLWLVRGLHERTGSVRWARFTSGLHEPMTLAIRDDQIYVFDRNGIWRVRDTNGDGEADVHELFSNAFAQTADMREFPNTIRLAPAGEFVIAKGNQQATTIGKHNGHVLRISADGRHATVLGYGFRQPNLGVNVRSGLVTASDQQGHYIPTTPLHVVKDGQFYGFLSDKQPREVYPAPIAEPLTWIPHATNASAMSQVWLFGAQMGPLNDQMVHIGFNKPELFRVLLNERVKKLQAAVVSVTRAFDFPPLNGSVNPIDGQLYLTGFQIFGWGTTASRMAGMGRVRYTGAAFMVPRELIPMDQGILLRFDVPLDRTRATDPDSFVLTSWHYQRTYKYGSPQYRADGATGMDRLVPSSAYLSKDGRSVFIGVANMKPVEQMRLAWSLATADGVPFQENAYFTPYEFPKFDPSAEGFGELTVNLAPRAVSVNSSGPATAEEGRRLHQTFGCVACHSVDSSSIDKLGPTFKGLYGRQRAFLEGTEPIVADDVYLKESILKPEAKITPGYGRAGIGMPSYAGVLTDQQIESLVLFIKTLK